MRRPPAEPGVRSGGRPGVAPSAGLALVAPAASVDGSGSRTNRRRGFSRGTKMDPLGVVAPPPRPSAPGAALPGVPAAAAAAARKSAGLRLMRVALMERRGRMRTPLRGVMLRGVMSAAGRGGPPASRPAGRCVSPTLYSGAGETCRHGSGAAAGQRAAWVGSRGCACWSAADRSRRMLAGTGRRTGVCSCRPPSRSPAHLWRLGQHAVRAGGHAGGLQRLRRHQRARGGRRRLRGRKAEGGGRLAGAKQAAAAKGGRAGSAKQASGGGAKGRRGRGTEGRRAGGTKAKAGGGLQQGRGVQRERQRIRRGQGAVAPAAACRLPRMRPGSQERGAAGPALRATRSTNLLLLLLLLLRRGTKQAGGGAEGGRAGGPKQAGAGGAKGGGGRGAKRRRAGGPKPAPWSRECTVGRARPGCCMQEAAELAVAPAVAAAAAMQPGSSCRSRLPPAWRSPKARLRLRAKGGRGRGTKGGRAAGAKAEAGRAGGGAKGGRGRRAKGRGGGGAKAAKRWRAGGRAKRGGAGGAEAWRAGGTKGRRASGAKRRRCAAGGWAGGRQVWATCRPLLGRVDEGRRCSSTSKQGSWQGSGRPGSHDCPKGDGEAAPKGEGEEDAPKPPKAGALAAAPNAGALVAPKAPNAGAAGGQRRGSRAGGGMGCTAGGGRASVVELPRPTSKQNKPAQRSCRAAGHQRPASAPEAAPKAGAEAPKAGLLAAPNAGLLAGAPKGEDAAPKPVVPKAPPAGEATPVLPLQPSCGPAWSGGVGWAGKEARGQPLGSGGGNGSLAAAQCSPSAAQHRAARRPQHTPPWSTPPTHLVVLPAQLLHALARVLGHARDGVEEDDWRGF